MTMNTYILTTITIYCTIWLPLAILLYTNIPKEQRGAREGLKTLIYLLITSSTCYIVYAIFRYDQGTWW